MAAKIFELGMRLFFNDVDYVVRYLNFLINKCDEASKFVTLIIYSSPGSAITKQANGMSRLSDINPLLDARALFERSVSSLESEKARPIWQRWLQYQMGVADLATLHKLDKRVADAYPSGELQLR